MSIIRKWSSLGHNWTTNANDEQAVQRKTINDEPDVRKTKSGFKFFAFPLKMLMIPFYSIFYSIFLFFKIIFTLICSKTRIILGWPGWAYFTVPMSYWKHLWILDAIFPAIFPVDYESRKKSWRPSSSKVIRGH